MGCKQDIHNMIVSIIRIWVKKSTYKLKSIKFRFDENKWTTAEKYST